VSSHTRQKIEPGEPHYPDFWANHRFSVRPILATDGTTWVKESFLPLVAPIDVESGDIGEPLRIERPQGTSTEATDFEAAAGALWIKWMDNGLTRFDTTTHESRAVPEPAFRLATGPAGIWVITPHGRVARVEEDGSTLVPVTEPEERRHYIAVGREAVWSLAWTTVNAPSTCTLSRIDPDSGACQAQLELSGSPQAMHVDDDRIWIKAWRQEQRGVIDEVIVGVDPDSLEVTSQLTVQPTGAAGIVRDGVLWALGVDPYAHSERGLPAELHRIDAASGEKLSSVSLPGWISWMGPGPRGVWGCLDRRGEWPGPVVEVAADGSGIRIFDLTQIDTTPFLPPPPPKIDAAEVESEELEQVRGSFFGGWVATDPDTGAQTNHPYIRGVTFDEVRLEGEFPGTEIVAYFRSEKHPDVLFGRRCRIWTDDGALDDAASVMSVNLMEDIEACGYGLPANPEPGPDGIVWF
jgi:hypothetical protein